MRTITTGLLITLLSIGCMLKKEKNPALLKNQIITCPNSDLTLQEFSEALHGQLCAKDKKEDYACDENTLGIGAELLTADESTTPITGSVGATRLHGAASTVKFPFAMVALEYIDSASWDINRWQFANSTCRDTAYLPDFNVTIQPNTIFAAMKGALEWSENRLATCSLFPLVDQKANFNQGHCNPNCYTQAIAAVSQRFPPTTGVNINRWRIYPYIHVSPGCAKQYCSQDGNSISVEGAFTIMREFWTHRNENAMTRLAELSSFETVGLAALKGANYSFHGKLGHLKNKWNDRNQLFNHFGQYRNKSKPDEALSVVYLHEPHGTHYYAREVGRCYLNWWEAR